MTEQELRAMVREAIARHGAAAPARRGPDVPVATLRQHPSHGLCAVPDGADADGPCVIEPAVPCNHCGYCKSFGH
jgi:hypothetical protein